MNTQLMVPVDADTRQVVSKFIDSIKAKRIAVGATDLGVFAYTLGYIESELCYVLEDSPVELRSKYLNRMITETIGL